MSAKVLPLFPELQPTPSRRRRDPVIRRGDRPELQSAWYWCGEMLRTGDEYRKRQCRENMVASLKALDHVKVER